MTLVEAAKIRAYAKQTYAMRTDFSYPIKEYYRAYDLLIDAGMPGDLYHLFYFDELQEAQRVIDFALAKGEEI